MPDDTLGSHRDLTFTDTDRMQTESSVDALVLTRQKLTRKKKPHDKNEKAKRA